jgi:hypothetical protein
MIGASEWCHNRKEIKTDEEIIEQVGKRQAIGNDQGNSIIQSI